MNNNEEKKILSPYQQEMKKLSSESPCECEGCIRLYEDVLEETKEYQKCRSAAGETGLLLQHSIEHFLNGVMSGIAILTGSDKKAKHITTKVIKVLYPIIK